MRRAMPARPLWPLKDSQSTNPAALSMAFTRRAIWDFDNPKTFLLAPTSAGRMAFKSYNIFGDDLQSIIDELNLELVR